MPQRKVRLAKPKKRLVRRLPTAAAVQKAVANTEWKNIEKYNTGATFAAAGTLVLLNGCQMGSTIGDREGRKTIMKTSQFWSSITKGQNDAHCGIALIMDTQPNAAAPGVTDIFYSLGGSSIEMMRDLSYRTRFVLLKKKYFTMDTYHPMRQIRWFKRLGQKVIYDNGDEGTIADITKNALYLFYISDQVTYYPLMRFMHRLRFTDM